MHVNDYRARNAHSRVRATSEPSRTHAGTSRTPSRCKIRATRRRYQQPSEHYSKCAESADLVDYHGEKVPRNQRMCSLKEKHYLHDKQSRTIGEWLDLCGIDLKEHGVRWPRDELDELSDLRFHTKQTSGQCIDWQIFKDDRVAHLPSFERLVPGLDIESCRDAWFLEKPIKLREDRFDEFKTHLLAGTLSKVRLLNVPVTKRMVSRRSQRQHSVMVRERVQYFYGVGDDHTIEIHDATTNVTPRGTATEIHHDSDPHISTACGEAGASFEQPMKLWLLWNASESRQLATCYSDTAAALRHLGPCGYLIQYPGESLMLPANVPHAALSLSSHYLYGQTFHVEGRARDPTTLELELSALAKPSEAIDTVLMCYEEGLQDPDARIRAVHTDHIVRTVSSEKTALHQAHPKSYVSKLVGVLRKHRRYNGVCGLCEHFKLSSQSEIDCWSMHDLEGEQASLLDSCLTDYR
jgi:hypothetical protein